MADREFLFDDRLKRWFVSGHGCRFPEDGELQGAREADVPEAAPAVQGDAAAFCRQYHSLRSILIWNAGGEALERLDRYFE